MAHFTNHRRTVATSEHPKSTSNTTLNPTNKSNPTAKTKNPDPIFPSKALSLPSSFSRLYTSYNIRTTKSNKPSNTNHSNVSYSRNTKDNLLQAKALNVSADFDSSKLQSLTKQRQPKISHELEKVRNKLKSDLVEVKMKKSSSYKEVVKEKKESNRVVEDVVDLESLDNRNSVPLTVSGRRRSFGGVQPQLSDVFASNGVKVVSVDMAPFMQIHAVDCARKTLDSLEKFSCKTLALTLKKEFDGVYGPAWHCIVGTSFGSFVTHSVGGFMYFSMDQKTYILLFKTTVQRAD